MDDYYDDHGGYDVVEHMTSDPVDFYTYGYGGFGYDTSQVKPNEKDPPVIQAAKKGDLEQIQMLVASAEDAATKTRLIHATRRCSI